MLDLEAFVFIKAHDWDGKTREMKSGEATTRSVHKKL